MRITSQHGHNMDAQKKRSTMVGNHMKKLEGEHETQMKKLQDKYEKIFQPFDDKWAKIEQGLKELQDEKNELAEQYGGSNVADSDIFHINAGGDHCTVYRSTLTQIEGSILAALFSGRWDKKLTRDSNDCVFLDIDPNCFRELVEYLMQCKASLPGSPPILPRAGHDDQVYMDGLLVGLGLQDIPQIDSKILVYQEDVNAVAHFLGQRNHGLGLSLLYRGTRDGMNAASFHEKCDNQGPTITVIRSAEGYIFGGYADKAWRGEHDEKRYIHSEKAFLFGLRCHGSSKPVKMMIKPDSVSQSLAFVHCSNKGPTFGIGYDINVFGGVSSYSKVGNSYNLPHGGDRFFFTGKREYIVDEVEVFKVEVALDCEAPSVAGGYNGSVEAGYNAEVEALAVHFGMSEEDHALFQEVFQAEKRAIAKATIDLSRKQKDLKEEKMAIKVFCRDDEVITFDLIDCTLSVYRSTLEKYPHSLLYKQLVDPNWKRKCPGLPDEWTSEQVVAWSKTIPGLSEDISGFLEKGQVNGAELLAMEREHVYDLGIERPGTVALVMKAIRELEDKNFRLSAPFIESGHYCFDKIINVMRLKEMADMGVPKPEPPYVRVEKRQQFEHTVKRLFPADAEAVAQFLVK